MLLSAHCYYLLTGDLYFSETPIDIKTTLGSCVAVTAWNPKTKVGGMCHYLLPSRDGYENTHADGFYGDFALKNMKASISQHGAISDFQIGVFGGGSLLGVERNPENVGLKNVEQALHWAERLGAQLTQNKTGGSSCRAITFHTETGGIEIDSHAVLTS